MASNLKEFEDRASAAEKHIEALKSKIDALEKGGSSSSSSSFTSPLPVGKIPIGHTAFSWSSGVKVAASAPTSSSSSSSSESNVKLTSVIIRHGAHQSALTKVTTAFLSTFAPQNFFKAQKKDLAVEEATVVPLGLILHSDEIIAKFLSRYFSQSELYGGDAFNQTEIDQWIFTAKKFNGVESLKELNQHLAFRTFLVGYGLTLADIAVFDAVKNLDVSTFPNVTRWLNFLSSQSIFQSVEEKKPAAKKAEGASKVDMGAKGAFLELKGAQKGKVVTRFPPEPSGYLHIGHAKAALLNAYYAKTYKGSLIVRFDDTNPSKEKDEFVESIMEDLKKLQVNPQKITYTSDYFDQILEFGEKLIKKGLGYVDTTPKLQIREERGQGIESKCRNQTVEENLKLWEEMKNGTELGKSCVVRGKIDMKAPNKVMRDPAFFRCVDTPHHRVGDKYKVYPLYDFACPIVDSLEGITHALRSNEYHDRNPLYEWFFDVAFPEIHRVAIEDFSRLNFKYVLLSKRKLQQFVDKGLVDGWNHPSFPTIQGVWRRGLTYDALSEFVLAQGGSKATNLMEMEKLWAVNKKVIDGIIPRHTALANNKVKFQLSNGPSELSSKKVPCHKKNPSLGEKNIYFSNSIFLEYADAQAIKEGEEVTLMDWGNAIIRKKVIDENGKITELQGELHLEGDFKTTDKKLTWLAEGSPLVPVKLEEYHYLITKEKLEENDNLDDFVNKNLVSTTLATGDPNLVNLKVGQQLQLERRGYFIVDKAADSPQGLVLINTPDGRKTNVYKLGE